MVESRPKPLLQISKVKKVTVKLPQDLKDSLPVKILNDGYNMRQKSKWVVEAVRSLLLSNKEWEGALLSETIVRADAQDVFSIPSGVVTLMNREAHRVAMENPSLNANQSTIIRAAINRRLLGFFQLIE